MEQKHIEIGSVSSVNPARRELRVTAVSPAYELQLKNLQWIRVVSRDGREARYRVATVKPLVGGACMVLSPGVLRDTVAGLKGASVVMQPEELKTLPGPERPLEDLDGFEVVDVRGESLGTVREVIRTPAHAVLEIEKRDGAAVLVPAIEEVIAEIEWDHERLVVNDLAPYRVDDAH